MKAKVKLLIDKLSSFSMLKKISIIYLLIVFLFSLIYVLNEQSYAEIDSYALPMISMQYRYSITIEQSDIDKAREDFPAIYGNVYGYEDLYSAKLKVSEDGKWHPYYFITYSLLCMPLKLLLQLIGKNQIYSLSLTNVMLFVTSLFTVLFKLKRSDKVKFITIILLSLNPIVVYIPFMSAEVFIFSMVVLSLIHMVNKEYKRSAIFVSLAGTMNSTIMMLGFAIIFLHFYEMLQERSTIKEVWRKKLQDTALLGCCYLIFLIPFLFFSTFSLGTLSNAIYNNESNSLLNRISSYLFDLNLGLFPYFTISLLLFFFFSIYGLIKKDFLAYCYMFSLYGTIFAYSLMTHINSGMRGIARYNAWVNPIIIFFLTCIAAEYEVFTKHKKVMEWLLYCSAILSACATVICGSVSYVTHTPIAKFVLNTMPQIYNPYYATFISRTTQIDGGYTYQDPIIYMDDRKLVRKILVTGSTADEVNNIVKGADIKSTEWLNGRIEQAKSVEGYSYISIPVYSSIKVYEYIPINFEPTDIMISTLGEGVYGNEGDYHWCSEDATLYLQVGNKKKSGMRLEYVISQDLFTVNPDKEIMTEVFVDGTLVTTIKHNEEGYFSITVLPESLPLKNADDIYIINLVTTGYFVPYDKPEVFAGNPDTRKLSFQLYYLGDN